MSQVYRRPHHYGKKKTAFRSRFLWLGVLAGASLILSVFFFVFSGFFQIGKITVEGAEKISAGNIVSLAEPYLENSFLFFKTKSIFLIDKEGIREKIMDAFPSVDQAKVSCRLPDEVKIIIQERSAAAFWCENSACFALDREGIVFEPASSSADLVKIIGKGEVFALGERAVEKDLLMKILDINSKLKQKAGLAAAIAQIVSAERLNIETSEGWQAYFNLAGDLDWQITELSLVLEKEIPSWRRAKLEYVDLRFSKVYYK